MQDLAAGYMSGKLLLKLDAVAFILGHHTAEHFAFLRDPGNSRARTAFYATLARLLFMEDTPARFKAFVAPLQQARSLLKLLTEALQPIGLIRNLTSCQEVDCMSTIVKPVRPSSPC